MNEVTLEQTAKLLKMLTHPERIRILLALSKQPSMNVSALQQQLQIDQAPLSNHLIKMKNKGVLTSKRQGKGMYYAIAEPSLLEALTKMLLSIA